MKKIFIMIAVLVFTASWAMAAGTVTGADPLLKSVSTYDFGLSTDSPAINTGVNLGATGATMESP